MIPVTVIGGYLGAGKTTLINNLLRRADGLRLAILVNDFGELAIDEDLIEAEEDDIISIAGGCICCSFGDDLISALMDISALNPRPDHVVIEASGVAIPASIAASLSLLTGLQLNGVVVLGDAETVRSVSDDKYLGDTILRQLQDADLVIMSKTDLVDEATARATGSWLETVAPRATVVSAHHGQIPVEVVLGPSRKGGELQSSEHSDALFASLVCRSDGPVDARKLAAELTDAVYGIIRAKGFVQDLSGATCLIQIVGRRWDVTEAPGSPDPAMVCIGQSGQLSAHALQRLFALG